MTTTRRQFLIASLSGIGASLLGVGCGDVFSQPSEGDDREPVPKRGREQFPETELSLAELVDAYFRDADLANVKLVGETYLRRFDSDTEAVEDLSAGVELVASLQDRQEALTRWDRAAIENFEGDGTVPVAGWQLARTECRLCGLAYHLL